MKSYRIMVGGILLLATFGHAEAQKSPSGTPSPPPTSGPAYQWPSSALIPTQHAMGDFNRDGRPDRVTYWFDPSAAFAESHGIWLELSQPDGSYTTRKRIVKLTGKLSQLSVGDFNGDGKFDISYTTPGLFGSTMMGETVILTGKGDGTFVDKNSREIK